MEAPHLTFGSRFGAYEIVRVIGRGAFGTVYEALRMPLRKRVALKVLSGEMARHRDAATRFLREAEAAAQLDHPHIVDVQDLGEVDGVPFLSMELLEGETLAARIHGRGGLTVAEAVDILLPVLSAIDAVHARDIVHRDLKPENIFLARGLSGDHPKLLDFGIAKVRQPGKDVTRTAALLGTPCYMSPEQVRDAKHIDGRSDLWSLGVILYECVTGRRPFDGESSFDVMERIVRAPITPPRAVVPAIPVAFEEVLAVALQRDPAHRFASARTFGAAILPFASPITRATIGAHFVATARFDAAFDGVSVPPSPPTMIMSPPPLTASPTLAAQEVLAPPRLPTQAPRRRLALLTALAMLGVFIWLAAAFVAREPDRATSQRSAAPPRRVAPSPAAVRAAPPPQRASLPPPSPSGSPSQPPARLPSPSPSPPVVAAPAAPVRERSPNRANGAEPARPQVERRSTAARSPSRAAAAQERSTEASPWVPSLPSRQPGSSIDNL